MNKFVVPTAIIAIIVGAGVVTYTLGTNQSGKEAANTSSMPTSPTISAGSTDSPQASSGQTGRPIPTPQSAISKSQVTENTIASVQSKNYAALEGYMADNVNVLLYATECCGIVSKQKATEQMSYLNGGTPPWDFSPTSSIAQKLIAADPANFAGRIIGVAANGMTVSFNLNAENKIDKIFISADHKLISP